MRESIQDLPGTFLTERRKGIASMTPTFSPGFLVDSSVSGKLNGYLGRKLNFTWVLSFAISHLLWSIPQR
jgi:hypothetical protein